MSRPRRVRRLPMPKGLGEVSLTERTLWGVSGPLLAPDGVEWLGENLVAGTNQPLYHVWPDWQTFMTFYRAVRDDWCPDRPWIRDGSAVEQLFQAWTRGEDVDAVRRSIRGEAAASDPRRRNFTIGD